MKTKAMCRVCGAELNDTNWYPSHQKGHQYICKSCEIKENKQWRNANPEKVKANWTRNSRKRGKRPMNENKECSAYLGVYIAEEVLSHVFKNVKRMPINNPGYDFICGGGYMVDIKSACRCHHEKGSDRWLFTINKNKIAEYFLCLAFDNRESLNPEHVWLIPSGDINNHATISISETAIHKWDDYKLNTTKVAACCNAMRHEVV